MIRDDSRAVGPGMSSVIPSALLLSISFPLGFVALILGSARAEKGLLGGPCAGGYSGSGPGPGLGSP